MFEKKVSVIVPVYNQEIFLEKSIRSICRQEYSNLEIILINDGSTDDSLKIINDYAKKDSRIVVISQDNRGLVGANITGIEHATGEYICFVDPDDMVGENFVSKFVEAIEDNEFIAMGIYFCSMNKKKKQLLYEDKIYSGKELRFYSSRLFGEDNTFDSCPRFFHSRCNKMYKTSLLREILEQYKECLGISLGEDSIFSYLILNKANTGKAVRDANAYYYNISNPHSMTKGVNVRKFLRNMSLAYNTFRDILVKNQTRPELACKMYFLFGNRLRKEALNLENKEYRYMYRKLHEDNVYMKVFQKIRTKSVRVYLDNLAWKHVKNPMQYKKIHLFLNID